MAAAYRQPGRDGRRHPQRQTASECGQAGASGAHHSADGDHVAVIGENRKLLIFRSRNCRKCSRQGRPPAKYRDGGISDAKVFSLKEGLIWKDALVGHSRSGARVAGLDRQPRRSRALAAKRISEEQPVRMRQNRKTAARVKSISPDPSRSCRAVLRQEARLIGHFPRAIDQ